MRIGLLARADKTGLGVQTFEFYRHMNPDRTLIIDLSHLIADRFAIDPGMYPNAWGVMRTISFPAPIARKDASEDLLVRFLDGLDIVFTCETPYHYRLIELAREMGVKTVLQYNYEYLDYLPVPSLPKPDLFAAPSMWHFEDVPFSNKKFLPVPVNREVLPFTLRTEAKTFFHPAGNFMNEDRNGTRVLLEAIPYVKSDVQFLIRSIYPIKGMSDSRVTVIDEPVKDYWDVYSIPADVLVMPRRFGGLCLPVNESMSLGMPVIMPNVSPQNSFLPSESLVQITSVSGLMTRAPLTVYNTNPQDLAAKIDELASNPTLVEELSYKSDRIASAWSWEALKPVYESTFTDLLGGGK